MARAMVPKGSHQTDWHDGNAELLCDAESPVLKFTHVPVTRAFGLRKNNQASAAVDCALRKTPHALQIRRTPHIRNWNVSKTLHQPPVGWNLEVRFQLPSAHKLRNGAVEHEGIEEIDVIRHEERRPAGIKAGTAANLHAGPGDTIRIERAGQPPMTVAVAGVVDLPFANSLFQKVGAPSGAQPSAPPDNAFAWQRAETAWGRSFRSDGFVRVVTRFSNLAGSNPWLSANAKTSRELIPAISRTAASQPTRAYA